MLKPLAYVYVEIVAIPLKLLSHVSCLFKGRIIRAHVRSCFISNPWKDSKNGEIFNSIGLFKSVCKVAVELLYTYHFNWRNETGKSKEEFLNSLSFNGGVADDFTRQKAQRLLKSVMTFFSSELPKIYSST